MARHREDERSAHTEEQADAATIYGEGFAAVYTTSRYAVYSRWLAKLALSVIERHGAPGQALLDLACGAGAGTLLFVKAGYDVSAVDGSAVMIDYAEATARKQNATIAFSRQDMRTLTLPYQVDIVTCLFDALNYLLNEDDLAHAFDRVARVLRPGGLFVFDMNTPHGLATRWGTKDVVATARADVFEANQNRYDAESGINTTTTTIFVRDDARGLYRRYTEAHRERGYSAGALTALLDQTGFDVLSLEGVADLYQGLARGLGPLTDEAGRVVIAARRRNE